VASAVVATQQQKDTPVSNKEASCLGVMDPADCNETVLVQRVCAGISSVEIKVGVSRVATAGVDVFHEPVPVEASVTAEKGAVSCRIRDQQSTQETASCRETNAESTPETASCREQRRHSGCQAASGCKVKCGVG